MKVCKFGGSSLADAAQINKVCDIVAADADRRVVVVSAPGRRHAGDMKVTDLLIACGEQALAGKDFAAPLAEVLQRFRAIQSDLGVPESVSEAVARNLEGLLAAPRDHAGRFMDAVKAAGEDNCARVVAAALNARGLPAVYLHPGEAGLTVTDEHGQARVLRESYEKLAALRQREEIVVFPGFFGVDRNGHVVTFSRGGSDITGSILAAAVQAEVYENFTDVDAVKAADPAIIRDAAPIGELTFREMRELAYAGFAVLHDEAIAPAVHAGIPICIRNTNRPDAPGTTIVPQHSQSSPRVVGIASSAGFCIIYVRKYLMNREIGFGRRLLQIFEEEGLLFEHMPSGIDDMSVVLAEEPLTPEREQRVVEKIREELDADDIQIERGLALVMIVGEGMRYAVGMAARATQALAEAGVNIEMMNQGSSEISMMFGVKAHDRARAVEFLYRAFFEDANAQ